MTTAHREPRRDMLAGVDRLIVDGSNVLGVLASSETPIPPATVIGRLRGAVAAGIRIDLVFDGPAAGSPTGRVAEGLAVRFSGRRSGDALIIDLASTAALGGQPPGANVLVVTDDRALAAQVRRHGVRVVGTGWLTPRLATPGRPRAAGLGHGRPPQAPARAAGTSAGATGQPVDPETDPRDQDAAADARRWRPGRGATAKVGAARKVPRTARSIEGRPWKRRRRSGG